jgi:hypothetical protein
MFSLPSFEETDLLCDEVVVVGLGGNFGLDVWKSWTDRGTPDDDSGRWASPGSVWADTARAW